MSTDTGTESGAGALRLLVKQIRHEADGVISVHLVDPHGAELPPWEPGSHLDVVMPGVPSGALVRQYSLSGDPTDRNSYRIAILDEPDSRGGSRWIHRELRVGALLEVSEPRCHFHFTATNGDCVRFVAGGIGITPILPMVREAQARGLDWHLTYGGRARASMAFLDELPPERVSLRPQDEVGLLDLAEAVGPAAPGKEVYACGPAPLLAALEDHCRDWPAGALQVERFAAPSDPAPAEEGENTGEIAVRAERSGIETVVGEGDSIMDCLERAGVNTPFSCREGICGTCETKVLDGIPAHHDYVLTDEEKAEGNTMMICVSRAKSARLVLDI